MAPRQRPRGNAAAAAAVPGAQLPLRVPLAGADEKKKGKLHCDLKNVQPRSICRDFSMIL